MTPEAGDGLAVDVVVTNHDYGRFLAEALDSALGQTHRAVRVIAVDDGSTDESRDVLSAYADRVDVVLKEQGGQASAINAGVERCEGDVLLLLDADDVLLPEAAARVSVAFAADPALAKVQFPLAVVDADGRRTGETKLSGHLKPPTGDLGDAEMAFPFDLPWLPGGGTAFRTELLRRILPIPEVDYPRCGADWYLVHLSALLGTAAALDEACAEYRVHGLNRYELDRSQLDLSHIRDSIAFAAATTRHLEELADRQGRSRGAQILSVADLANRMTSLKAEPRRHPIAADSPASLLALAVRAVGRRFDVAVPMKALYLGWFAAMALAPRRLAVSLAELFMFPERRAAFGGVLGRLQRRGASERLAD